MSVEAPERIFIAPNHTYTNPWGRPILTDDFDDDGVEYVRADKLEELELHVRHADAYLQSAQGAIQRAEAAEAALAEAKRENEAQREAGLKLMPYLRWTIGPESLGHHPTMPSAVNAFIAELEARNAGGKDDE